MLKSNWIAGILLLVGVAAAAAMPLIGLWKQPEGILLHARMADIGGWTPENLTAAVGQPLTLRLTSDDVTHGFAVGQMAMQPVDVNPGEISQVTLTFDHPGKYTFYCTRWCGPNHWRMRGTIDVSGPETGNSTPVAKPLYVTLGIDLDAPHPAVALPAQKPSAAQADELKISLPSAYLKRDYYLAHSTSNIWQALRQEPGLKEYSDQDIWDLVAVIARTNTTPQLLKEGQQLYAANCAACHGETGGGDGVMAGSLGKNPMGSMATGTAGISGHETIPPVNFTDPATALGASPALLQGKILRGGMGTGMPNWGPVFTDEQIWALVAYIQSFQLEMEK